MLFFVWHLAIHSSTKTTGSHAPFCAVKCYQAHGTACTEPFFRKHVLDQAATDKSKAPEQLVGMLRREQEAWGQDSDTMQALINDQDDDSNSQDDTERFQRALELIEKGKLEEGLAGESGRTGCLACTHAVVYK